MSESQRPGRFDELSIDEKIDLVQRLWEEISSEPREVPVPDWHKEIVQERLAAYRANPKEGSTWDEVRARIEGNLRTRKR